MSDISTISMEWLPVSANNTRNASAFFPRAALSNDSQQIGRSEQHHTQAHALT